MFIKRTKYTNPTYVCDKCSKKMEYRPKRLTLKEYENSYYGHKTICNYDLCNRCYEIFNKWIKNGGDKQ